MEMLVGYKKLLVLQCNFSQISSYYDYVRDIYIGAQMASSAGQYVFDSENERPFWEPASVEDELRKQLQTFIIPSDGLT